ncbi:T9SS type A sorting domain-containing protein [Marinoscillum sp. MHG1-6]|uniref:pectate lyase family protein n=1 Tax=Marinoscillum sp. MHG1-6 TaxID=2959627 RepID=UPI00215892B5|nr:T9SS type A sorting domain-containing protein [Marinoscillum sp. MHG1-6]
MKHSLCILLLVCIFFPSYAQSIAFTEAQGWIESAFVKWVPIENADTYNVYYSGEGVTDKQIDDQLIRSYGSYFRADIPGLKAGRYTIKVAAVTSGIEGSPTETDNLTVTAHDRTGFSFSNGRVPGAYKADGTPKSGAVVLYITENTKNIISMDVTGATTNPCIGLQTILDGFKKGKDNRPLIIRLVGQITDLSYMLNGDVVVENGNNPSSYITLEGIGDDAVADGWGIRIKNATNIEVRNLATMNCNSGEGDNIGLQQNNDYIWVHHNDFFYGDAGGDADQAKGDGALDCKKSTYVTFSYNHFWDTGKSNLLGLSEGTTSGLYITYHHNWYDHSDSRHPRVRFYSAHVYNNYYDGNAKYGIGSTEGSSVFVEGNYFRNCRYPMLTSMQGSDVYDEGTGANDYTDMPTFSKEDGGTIKAYNNFMTGQRRFVAYGDTDYPNATVEFDAYVTSTRNETLSSSITSAYGSNTYNNFDTNGSIMYSYTADSPEQARDEVIFYSGRVRGGDFDWTFNNAVDDASYDVNSALKNALSSYQTSLVSIQGDGDGTGNSSGGDPGASDGGESGGSSGGGSGSEITGDIVHNFTISGLSSEYFSITGNLSDAKGTVTYGNLTLTQCLKIESSTTVDFTTTEEGELTLVFNEGFSGNIKIDGVSQPITNGILTLTLASGSHQITKVDVANLYLISITYSSSTSGESSETEGSGGGTEGDTTGETIDGGNSADTTGTITGTKPSSMELIIYPNPVESFLNIQVTDRIDNIEIYSLTGRLICRYEGVNLIDVDFLNRGSYLVKIMTSSGSIQKMILKK